MKTVTLDVRSLNDNLTDFADAWKTGQAPRQVEESARISFTSPE